MTTPTYDLIESVTLTTSASSVTFSSITQDFSDLVLVISVIDDANGQTNVTFNNDTGSNYSRVIMGGDGSSTFSVSGTLSNIQFVNTTSVEPAVGIMNILDYSATDKHKSLLCNRVSSGAGADRQAVRYASTTAITEIDITIASGNYTSGSTFNLYGIAA